MNKSDPSPRVRLSVRVSFFFFLTLCTPKCCRGFSLPGLEREAVSIISRTRWSFPRPVLSSSNHTRFSRCSCVRAMMEPPSVLGAPAPPERSSASWPPHPRAGLAIAAFWMALAAEAPWGLGAHDFIPSTGQQDGSVLDLPLFSCGP